MDKSIFLSRTDLRGSRAGFNANRAGKPAFFYFKGLLDPGAMK